jgi:hypothetical protein
MSLFGGRQAETQFLTVRQSDFQQKPAGIAVAKRCITKGRVVAGLE